MSELRQNFATKEWVLIATERARRLVSAALRRVAPDDARVVTAPDVDELWPRLAPRLAPDATILLKASRGVRLERILPHITTWATTSC